MVAGFDTAINFLIEQRLVFKVDGRIFMITMTIRGRALVNLKAEPQKSLLNHIVLRPKGPAVFGKRVGQGDTVSAGMQCFRRH
jgi:hypothetical protein